jgi:hypothetical protein
MRVFNCSVTFASFSSKDNNSSSQRSLLAGQNRRDSLLNREKDIVVLIVKKIIIFVIQKPVKKSVFWLFCYPFVTQQEYERAFSFLNQQVIVSTLLLFLH